MKTVYYNPSQLEISFVKALEKLKDQLSAHLKDATVIEVQPDYTSDNPYLLVRLKDEDNDEHELVVQVIQRPDSLVK